MSVSSLFEYSSGISVFLPLFHHDSPTSSFDLEVLKSPSSAQALARKHLKTRLHSSRPPGETCSDCSLGVFFSLLASLLTDTNAQFFTGTTLLSFHVLDCALQIHISTNDKVDSLWHAVKYSMRNQWEVAWDICHSTVECIAILDLHGVCILWKRSIIDIFHQKLLVLPQQMVIWLQMFSPQSLCRGRLSQ